MKRIIYLLVSLFFISCENSEEVELQIADDEYIVVQAILPENEIFQGVSITKTLPLNEPYDIKKAEITDAEVYLKINGVQIIPLHYESDGIYKPKYQIRIKPKSVYKLFAEVNGKKIYSISQIPQNPEVVSVGYTDSKYLTASIRTKVNESYGAIWVIQSSVTSILAQSEDFFSVEAGNDVDQLINVRTQEIPSKYANSSFEDILYIKVYSFDKSYLEFFKSKNNNRAITNVFSQGSGSVAWNVYGEKVIGLFIGMNEGILIKP